ncbi:MAG: Response regulator receiver domain [Acidobacteriota bacterium]|jgi:DNA-binding response OmpR family regulator|nr:Response regulator receiver domain [Acidobacteriota bacterium]
MNTPLKGKRILLIDHQSSWREAAGNILAEGKFLVRTSHAYTYSEPKCYVQGGPPDVVILGCATVKREERRLVAHVIAHKRHLVILCAALPGEDIRQLFLAGANDVSDKPYSPRNLLHVISEVLLCQEVKDNFRERMLRKQWVENYAS